MTIYLRAFELSDLPLLNKWHNSTKLNQLTGGRKYFVSSAYDQKWLEDKIFNNQHQIYCAICDSTTHEMLGYISLVEINHINQTAQWGGIVITPENKGHGAATQATIQLLKYGFMELNLQKISGRWVSENNTSILMAKVLGFSQEGVLRREVFKNNQFYDVLVMSILKEEFENQWKQKINENN